MPARYPLRALVLAALALATLAYCSGAPPIVAAGADASNPRVRIVTSMGVMEFALDRGRAPLSTANFLAFAARGAYDGTTFHRVLPEFVIQGGGWTPGLEERAKRAAAAGQPDVPIHNEWQNGLRNLRGTIAMAREEGPDTATREFFINCQDNPKLDTARDKTGHAGYAVFGQLINGLDVLDRIRLVPTAKHQLPGTADIELEAVPVTPVVIERVEVLGR